MIQVKPMEDREEERQLLEAAGLGGVESRILAMTDRDRRVGWAAVAMEEDTLRIKKLWVDGYDFSRKPEGEECFILDTLMRSAASYGEHYGAGRIATSFPDFYDFFRARGFETDETHAFTPMSTIVRYEPGVH